MKTKKLLSFIISLAMFLSILPINHISVSAASFAGGSGTEADPYTIATLDQLKSFRDDVNNGNDYSGKYIELTKNINLGGSNKNQWTPIGGFNRFHGTFDGDGHQITGLYINHTTFEDGRYMGFFGSSYGTIKNLEVSGEVIGYSAVGGIAGGNSGTIENCRSNVSVTGSGGQTGASRIGGIVGQNSGYVRNCYNTGSVIGNSEFGSIVGGHLDGKIVNCYYLSGTASGGVDGKDNGTAAKTEREFKNGSVTYLLQSGQPEQVWGQRLGTDNYPALTGDYPSKKVCKVSFMIKDSSAAGGYKEYAAAYGNKGKSVYEFPDNPATASAYVFRGWTKSKDSIDIFGRYDKIPSAQDMTVYAVEDERTAGTNESGDIKLTQREYTEIDLNKFVKNQSGATKNFSFTLSDSTLPDGLTLTNGVISGAPKSAGKSTVKYKVKNNGYVLMSAYDETTSEITLNLDVGLQGDGTSDNPYKIWDLSSITYLRDAVNNGNNYSGKYIKLMADINLGGSESNQWTPIGSQSVQFGGKFDGSGHKITGLYINNSNMHQGLFSYLNNGGEVKNLSISGTVTAKSNVGSIVGYNGGNIENCFSDVTVTGTGTYIGGIAGYNSDGTIKNCVNVGKVSGSGMLGSIVGGVSVWYVNNNCYYLKGTAANGVGGGTGGGGDRGISARTVDEFKSGYIAYSLQNKQSDSSKQAWGQTISGANKDDYPVLTSDAAKKVYRIRFMANNEGKGNYNTHSTAYSNNGGTVALPSHTSDKFRGWSERVNGSKLSGGFVTATNADKDFYSLWKVDVTFKVSDTNYVYKTDTPREITVDPSITAIPKSDISVKYYTVDENDGNLKSTTPIQSAITVGKYLYVIDITGSSADEYYIKRKYAAANTNLPNLSEFDNIGYMYISATTEQQDVFSIEDIPESVYYGDSFTVSPYGASGTVTYEITDGADIASIDKTSGKVTVTGVGKVTIRAKSVLDGYEDRYAVRSFAAKKRALTPTVTADDRQYNGENGVSVSISLNNIANNDGISAAASGSMINADAGDGKIVYVSGVALSGDKKDLYTLSSTTLQTTVNITPIDILSFTISAADKKYDGTTNASATVTDISGVLDKDKSQVQIVGSAEFDSADSADGKTVTYTAHGLSGSKAANYTLSAANAAASANIKPLNIDFVIGQTSFVYDGTDKNINVSASDENGRIFKDYQISYTDESGTAAAPKEAGNYTAKITLNDTTNYTTMQSDIPVTVAKAAQNSLVIAGLPGTVRYGDSFDMEAVGGADGGTYEWTVNNASVTLSASGSAVTTVTIGNAVGQKIEIDVVKKTDNYSDISAKVVFVPAAKDITFNITNLEQTYDGNTKQVNAEPSDPNATYDITYNEGAELPKNAGIYTVKVSATGNYRGTQTATLIINKATPSGDIAGINNSYTYGEGVSASPLNCTDGTTAKITYAGTGIYIPQEEAPKNVGSYTAILTISGENFETVTKTQNFVIKKAPLKVWAKNVSRAYGEANPIFEIEYDAADFRNGDTKAVILSEPAASTNANASSPVGKYNITVSGGSAENYRFEYLNDENDNLGVLEVTGAMGGRLVITGASSTASVGQTFMLQAFYGNTKVDAAWATSDPSVAEIDADGTVRTLKSGEVTFTATADENYSNATATFTMCVVKTYVNLYAADTVKTYNGSVQSVTLISSNASFTPILSGADKNVDVKYALITDGSVTEPKNAGTYAVSFTVTDESFSGGGNATLYINKANIAVKAKDISKEYGEDPIYELEIIGGDSNAATAEEFMNYVTFTSDGANKKANVNTYDINVSLTSDGDANRSLTVSDQKGLMTVTKAPLTIKVKDVTREYGAVNPTLEAEYIGFKNDETKDVLTGELVLDYDESINEQTPIGEYPDKTTASGADAANYAITFEQGKVTITKIGVNASAGTARPSYINVNFDKALEGLTADNFVIKNGEETVTPTGITASNDNKTYTLNGSFSTSVTYIITPNLTGTEADNTYEIISGPISVRPSSGGSSGGGGGGGGAASYFTVSFETNGGSKIDSITVARNKTAAEPSKPVKDGFTFDGWYADKELKTVYDFAQKVTKNITLYAKWTAEDTKPDKPSGGSDGSEWKNPFVDVSKDDWFYDDVKYVNKNGLMNGTSSTTFEPNSSLTRDMFVTILWRAEGKPQANYAMTFNDVPANTYYTEAVRWAASEKIVKGYSETEFRPSDKITREQIAAIIHRYAGYKGYNASIGDNTDVLAYADYKDISDWALESVIFCRQNGIMKGNDLNEFKPLDSILRSEAAAIIRRFIETK